MRIFLERGEHHAHITFNILHKALDEFCGTVAHHHVFLFDAKTLACQQRVNIHARRIFGQKGVKVGFHLGFHLLTRKVGVYQIAVVQHLWKTPMPTIAIVIPLEHLVIFSENGFCNVQVLHIVYLVPLLITNVKCLEIGFVQERNHAQHLFVIFVIAQSLTISIKKRNVLCLRKHFAKLVNVHRFIIRVNLLIVESLFGNKVYDVAIAVNAHHGTVHPCLIFGNEGNVGTFVGKNHGEQSVREDEVRLYQERVVFLHLLLYQRQ